MDYFKFSDFYPGRQVHPPFRTEKKKIGKVPSHRFKQEWPLPIAQTSRLTQMTRDETPILRSERSEGQKTKMGWGQEMSGLGLCEPGAGETQQWESHMRRTLGGNRGGRKRARPSDGLPIAKQAASTCPAHHEITGHFREVTSNAFAQIGPQIVL